MVVSRIWLLYPMLILGVAFSQPAADSAVEAAKAIRHARELIESETWPDAVEKFRSVLARYPRERGTDSALYWLAYALKKQHKLKEASDPLQRLIREFPASSWIDDARAMQVEIAGQTADKRAINQALGTGDEELKLIALQSLFGVDRARATAMATKLLQPESSASSNVKQAAVNLLARHGGSDVLSLLVTLARNETQADLIREEAIYWIAQRGNAEAVETLIRLFEAGRKGEFREKLLYWLAQADDQRARNKIIDIARTGDNPQMRQHAIYWVVQRQAIDDLAAIYGSEKDESVKGNIIYWLAQSKEPRAREKLVAIGRTEPSEHLREHALYWLAQRGDIASLVEQYDMEKSQEVKDKILYLLATSNESSALAKLFQVARSDNSQHLRKRAVYLLGQSKHPDAVRFIEQILR